MPEEGNLEPVRPVLGTDAGVAAVQSRSMRMVSMSPPSASLRKMSPSSR
jgi:hypothetical protein